MEERLNHYLNVAAFLSLSFLMSFHVMFAVSC